MRRTSEKSDRFKGSLNIFINEIINFIENDSIYKYCERCVNLWINK